MNVPMFILNIDLITNKNNIHRSIRLNVFLFANRTYIVTKMACVFGEWVQYRCFTVW